VTLTSNFAKDRLGAKMSIDALARQQLSMARSCYLDAHYFISAEAVN